MKRKEIPAEDSLESGESDQKKKKKEKKERKRKKKQKKEKEKKTEEDEGRGNDEAPDLATAAIDYLILWRDDRESWRFKKRIQVWLLSNMYNPSLVKKQSFQILLKYLVGLQGKSREKTLADSQEILSRLEARNKTGSASASSAGKGPVGNGEEDDKDSINADAARRRVQTEDKLARIHFSRANAVAKLLA